MQNCENCINKQTVISKAETLAISARNSLSDYCHTECLALCCRGGYLLLSEKEVSLMGTTKIKDLSVMPQNSRNEQKKYAFNLGQTNRGCPNLEKHKCKIHTNPLRPKACKEFPLFIFKKTIVITDNCPAVKENKLYPYLAEFKTMGYKVVYSKK